MFSSDFFRADELYSANLVALNGSDVIGKALFALNDDVLSVMVAVSGLDPAMGQPHLMHIHGFPSGSPEAMNPTLSSDADGDGFIEVAEGGAAYGSILLPLGGPAAPDGSFLYMDSFQLPSPASEGPVDALDVLGLTTSVPLDRREIVVHGLTLDSGDGATNANSIIPPIGLNEADGTAGYKVALPVASGEIVDSPGRSALAQFRNAVDDMGLLGVAPVDCGEDCDHSMMMMM